MAIGSFGGGEGQSSSLHAPYPSHSKGSSWVGRPWLCGRRRPPTCREVVDLHRFFFMRDRVGDVLEGTISGVASFGVFVAADQPFVEGLDLAPLPASLAGRLQVEVDRALVMQVVMLGGAVRRGWLFHTEATGNTEIG
jgi:hypothetical protein